MSRNLSVMFKNTNKMFCNKFYLLWYVIIMCVCLKVQSADTQWGKDCPRSCTCEKIDFTDLPIVKWMYNGIKSEQESYTFNTQNEVIGDNEENPISDSNGQLFKTALCMFMNVTKPKEFLNFLPLDTEALVLYQTTDSNDIIIEDDIKLPKLISFEIHGNNNQKNIYITDEMFKSLSNIKYINIQSVSLEKLTLESNEPVPTIDTKVYTKENSYAYNELVPVLPMHLHKENNKNAKKKLIFLQPKDVDMVPYETYKKTKRRTKSNNLFINNKDLLFLRITNCGLKYISWNLFNGLNSLATLILDNNAIDYIPDFSFYGASMLKSLSLSNNKIRHLQTTSLGGLLELNYLNLKNNDLSILSETTFPPLPKLQMADLSNNPIETVYPHTFEVLNATRELKLGSNNTQLNLHQNSFVGLDFLEILHLIGINVTVFERTLLTGLSKLTELSIKGTMKHIAFDAFVEVPNIKRLILSNCSIESVSMDSFYGIYNLENLDLSYNQLQELPPGLFDQQFSLKELILNNNQLIDLPEGVFKTISNVKLIRLDMNPLHCTCQMKSWDISLMTQSTIRKKKLSCEWDHLKKEYDCPIKSTNTYIYNKKIEPVCSSPTKFKGMSISYVLSKYLNCQRKSYVKNNLNTNKKYKEFKYYKLLNEEEAKRQMLENTTLVINPQHLNFSNNISNNTKSIVINNKNVAYHGAMEMVEKGLETNTNITSYTTERSVLLNNGTYISKSLLKEEIYKIRRKNKTKINTQN